MTTNAGVSMSHHHNPSVAGRDAAKQALKNASIRACANRRVAYVSRGNQKAVQSL